MNKPYLILGAISAVLLVLGVAYFFSFQDSQTILTNSPAPTVSNADMLRDNEGSLRVETVEPVYFENVKGYYARPERSGDFPGVVMIHEWWGLNENIKDMARQLAAQGYMVLAVDLFNGKVAANPDEARGLTGSLDKNKATQNLRAAVAFLRDEGVNKVGSLGWCFGGGQSLQLSLSGEPLDATVIYYGQPVTDRAQLQKIKGPVLGIFGDKDTSIPVDTVNQFKASLVSAGVPNSINIYPGVGHAFANPSGANYAPNETKDAWAKTLAFLEQNLKDGGVAPTQTPGPTVSTQATVTPTRTPAATPAATTPVQGVKEFNVSGLANMRFSVNEMRVKKGDKVKINFKVEGGMHDWVVDEFNARTKVLQTGQSETIEFTADKTGTFEYYCSVGSHRAMGMVGKLIVE